MFNLFVITFVNVMLSIISCNGFNIQPRMINSFEADLSEFPFYVLISTYNPYGASRFCGGTLISDTWVLTAAHCIKEGESLDVHLGSYENDEYEEIYIVEINDQYIHPKYRNVSIGYDLCLLELPARIDSEYIKPVQFPDDCGANIYEENVISIGKGWTAFDEDTGDRTLRLADLVTFSMDDCENYAWRVFDISSVICAFSVSGQSVHNGDSGGPLLFNDMLIGVTSYTQEYNETYNGHTPFVAQTFTKVHYYFDWISEVTGLELPQC